MALLVPTAAMIVVLSLQNGLSGLVKDVYSKFDSELRVVPLEGQYFEPDSLKIERIREFAEVSGVLQSNVLLEWNGYSAGAVLRGVDSNFVKVSQMPTTVARGEWKTLHGQRARAVLGSSLSYNLALTLGSAGIMEVTAIVPVPKMISSVPIVSRDLLMPAGVFRVDAVIDSKYLFTDIGYVRDLLSRPRSLSSLEIKPNIPLKEATAKIEEILGDDSLMVESATDQRKELYAAFELEKYVIFMILCFIALIAAMALSGCALLMSAEKAQNAKVLRSLGMSSNGVRRIFMSLAGRIVAIGVGCGTILGIGFVVLQQNFKILAISGETSIVDSYPVILTLGDTLLSVGIMLGVGAVVIYLTLGRQKF
ncbi:MAG: hypothetical protein R3Y49_04140 [Rikenellaceae bacterium]